MDKGYKSTKKAFGINQWQYTAEDIERKPQGKKNNNINEISTEENIRNNDIEMENLK